jgi:signal peptidase I
VKFPEAGGILEVARTIVIVIAVALLVRAFIAQPFYVIGPSMEPSYHQGEYLIVDELSYRLRDPKRGEVIVLRFPLDPSKDFIKRIVGLPGEKVRVEGGVVTINGEPLPENYTDGVPTEGGSEVVLAEDEYFVLGDNRHHGASSDSRDWGPLSRSNIIGKVWVKLWPIGEAGLAKQPDY